MESILKYILFRSSFSGTSVIFSTVASSSSSYFTTRRSDVRSGWLVLKEKIQGPKVIEVDFQAREHQRNDVTVALYISRIKIFISEYDF